MLKCVQFSQFHTSVPKVIYPENSMCMWYLIISVGIYQVYTCRSLYDSNFPECFKNIVS